MKKLFLPCLLVAYLGVVIPLSSHMENRPVVVKLGYTPDAQVLKVIIADQRYLASEGAVLKVLFYFGSLVEQWKQQVVLPPEYYNMYKTIETAVQLDPYNMDAYYFAQAAFTWEIGRAYEVNRLLDYGMQYRDWDYYLPFFAGFNAAYFLKDYSAAADYMKTAAEISGNPLFTNLAARYFYESNRAELGALFLDSMEDKAQNPHEKQIYRMRRETLKAVDSLNKAVRAYQQRFGALPEHLDDLVTSGTVTVLPKDPYGGSFFLDEAGQVRTSSKMVLEHETNMTGH